MILYSFNGQFSFKLQGKQQNTFLLLLLDCFNIWKIDKILPGRIVKIAISINYLSLPILIVNKMNHLCILHNFKSTQIL